jgi:hypothetical protein
MHKQRIIDGIEKVFDEYSKDEELRKAIAAKCYTFLHLFPADQLEECYDLGADGGIYSRYVINNPSPSRLDIAARAYFEYFKLRCKPPLTLTKAKAMLEEDLGKRVEELKRDYVRHFDNECNRQAENRHIQHPEA